MFATRLLQLTVLILCLVPLLAGGAGAIDGAAVFGEKAASAALDSHIRYLSGLLFAIGLGFLSCVPDIARKTARFRMLTLIVFVGGITRAGGLLGQPEPGPAMFFGLGMELLVTPLLCLWQARIARRPA